jgi:DNA-binding GntR family transcriptional regulator
MERLPARSALKPRGAGKRRTQPPLYSLITKVLRTAIRDGSLKQGAVILEGAVAGILRSTRTPVRQALHQLEEERLVSRFDGRGYVVGPPGVAPRRITVTASMLGIESDAEPVRKTLGWEGIYDEVERDVVHLSVFGRYRVSELELARHFGVGRNVARDVLLRLEGLGLLEKDERLRWAIIALDANRIKRLYELRWLLEPAALTAAASQAPAGEIEAMTAELRQAMRVYPRITRSALDALELNLHVKLLAHCPNQDLLQSLQRTRCTLTLSKHVLGVAVPMPKRDPFMKEHFSVLVAVAGGNFQKAESLLRKHLENSCAKVTERVAAVRAASAKPDIAYVR